MRSQCQNMDMIDVGMEDEARGSQSHVCETTPSGENSEIGGS